MAADKTLERVQLYGVGGDPDVVWEYACHYREADGSYTAERTPVSGMGAASYPEVEAWVRCCLGLADDVPIDIAPLRVCAAPRKITATATPRVP
jgi:hypothetical protein